MVAYEDGLQKASPDQSAPPPNFAIERHSLSGHHLLAPCSSSLAHHSVSEILAIPDQAVMV
jgi:hypothetical protein